jgi:hypothetical protein
MSPHRFAAAAAALLAVASSAAHAQGALKPVEALIVNPPSRPVPVSVVAPAAAPTVTCRIDVDITGSLLPIPSGGAASQIASLDCPAGVSKIDLHRAVFVPGSRSENQVHFTVSVALGHFVGNSPVIDSPIATLSDGSPDLSLARPVRIDKTAAGVYAISSMSCSSGIAGLAPRCHGTVLLVGSPVN